MRYGYKNNYYSCFFLTNTQNVRLYYPYWQYTNLFIFRYNSMLLCFFCDVWNRTCEPWSRTCEPWSWTCEPWSRLVNCEVGLVKCEVGFMNREVGLKIKKQFSNLLVQQVGTLKVFFALKLESHWFLLANKPFSLWPVWFTMSLNDLSIKILFYQTE